MFTTAAGILAAPAVLAAQGAAPARLGPTPAVGQFAPALARASRVAQPDTGEVPGTHWVEGAVIGAAALGLSAAVVAASFCAFDESGDRDCAVTALLGGAVGAGVGFTVGGLIGGAIPKRPPAPADSTGGVPAAARSGGWGIGSLVAAGALVAGGFVLGAEVAGPVGAIAGASLGVLVGSHLR